MCIITEQSRLWDCSESSIPGPALYPDTSTALFPLMCFSLAHVLPYIMTVCI